MWAIPHSNLPLTLFAVDNGVSSPDFMIVHPPLYQNKTPLELHGYPPWHIRLTEMQYVLFLIDGSKLTTSSYNGSSNHRAKLVWPFDCQSTREPLLFDEITFNHALDEFAAAEMRFGK